MKFTRSMAMPVRFSAALAVLALVTSQAAGQTAKEFFSKGARLLEKGEHDKAIAELDRGIRLDPQHASAYYNRGYAWGAKQEYDKAIADYSEAIRLNPKYVWAFGNRGRAWAVKGEYDKAIADYDEEIRLDPRKASAYFNRGCVRVAKQEYDKAIADYSEAIRLDPRRVVAYSWRGSVWYARQEYGKAIADYSEAIRLDPRFTEAYNGRAWIWATCPDAKIRDGGRAVESATKACELSGWKAAYPVEVLAAACAEAGDFDKAVSWQEKALALYADTKDREKASARIGVFKAKRPYRATPGTD
jgi:tetratricopeptide (TPR) repeat protein